jgi:hypothetical protein
VGRAKVKPEKFAEDLRLLQELLQKLAEEGAYQIRGLREYLWASPPRRKERATKEASAGYRMRMLTLELWNKRRKLRVHLACPELRIDGINRATERSIGKSNVRYKSIRGYKNNRIPQLAYRL